VVDKKMEQIISVAKMKMHKRMSEMIREDMLRNEYERGSIGIAGIVDILGESRFRWFSYVMRREDSEVVRTVMEMNIEERRKGPKKK